MPMNEDIDFVKCMLFLRVLEGTFVLTIISLCSNANNVGDLKILTPKFVVFLLSCF